MRKESGFTIMELMVAIAIIAILSAVATPNMISWRNNTQFNSAIRSVKSAIEETRMNAVKSNLPARLDFIDGGRSFKTLKWDMTANNFGAPRTHRLPPDVILVNSNFTDDQLQFTGRGMPLSALGGTLTLKNVKGNLCRCIVVASVGTSRISECP